MKDYCPECPEIWEVERVIENDHNIEFEGVGNFPSLDKVAKFLSIPKEHIIPSCQFKGSYVAAAKGSYYKITEI